MEIVVVVVVGDSILRGEDLVFRFVVVIKGSVKGLGIFRVCGLVVILCVILVGEIVVGVGFGVRRLFVIIEENIYFIKVIF